LKKNREEQCLLFSSIGLQVADTSTVISASLEYSLMYGVYAASASEADKNVYDAKTTR